MVIILEQAHLSLFLEPIEDRQHLALRHVALADTIKRLSRHFLSPEVGQQHAELLVMLSLFHIALDGFAVPGITREHF